MAHRFTRIARANALGMGVIELVFEDGFVGLVNIRPHLRGPLFQPLLDDAYLAKLEIDPEVGTVVWPNGADFDPDSLRVWAEDGGSEISVAES